MTNPLRHHQCNDFCIQELILYLDTHPDDASAWRMLRKHLSLRDELKNAVQCKMGPLTCYDNETADNKWTDGPWPWEREANQHVDL